MGWRERERASAARRFDLLKECTLLNTSGAETVVQRHAADVINVTHYNEDSFDTMKNYISYEHELK